ncbi:DUF4270 domain-containing protein [Flavobacterium sp. ACN6]|uniref:DUF4270 domain-containing protein n=1 Tax=Flavobacterium sp. ACN6 TaxID=1920426 RepID=UPI000BB36FBA|nr:DUF4270 domain-containing protein [Flavobacterium sp. ACN6]PBJ12899.1 hypothetical protein BSF42_20800 [Flavobacterium sp. ACN6]
MYNTSFIKKFLLALIVVCLYSCDKDFNAIGDGLIGDDHFGLEPEEYSVLAFNQEVTPIQSNNLAVNALGIFTNPLFGTTTANFATQLALASYPVTIGESPVIESAVLTIPYFNHITATGTDGANTYVLDSIYGGQGKDFKLKLSVYESGYQMRSSYFSGGSQLPQFYYTDQNNDFFSNANKALLNNGPVQENVEFYFDPAEIVTKTTDPDTKVETVTRTAPQMVLNLRKDFFQEKILNAPASKLSSEDLFQEYFRGLYFMVEKSGANSNMAMLDFSKGVITIKYKAKTAATTDGDATEDKQILVNFKSVLSGAVANTASFLQDDREANYQNAVTTNVNETAGDERLYLKGGQGSLAVVKLFNQTDVLSYNADGTVKTGANQVPDELDEIRNNVVYKNWKVNEANLVFYIDADKMGTTKAPQRVYLYDLTNNTVLADYSADPADPFGGLIILDSDKKGKSYKLRITSHIRNLIKDATAKNVDLGIVVSLSAGVVASNALKQKNETISQAPRTSVMSPLGTILYGGKASVPDDKRLKLQVYYTKPN